MDLGSFFEEVFDLLPYSKAPRRQHSCEWPVRLDVLKSFVANLLANNTLNCIAMVDWNSTASTFSQLLQALGFRATDLSDVLRCTHSNVQDTFNDSGMEPGRLLDSVTAVQSLVFPSCRRIFASGAVWGGKNPGFLGGGQKYAFFN